MDLNDVIIVTDKDYFPLVFSLKNAHPEYSWKVLDREDLLDRVSFSFKDDPIPTLIKQGISYNDAKKYISLFRAADFSKNERLNALFSSVSHLLERDDLGLFEISSKPLVLLEMQEDVEVHKLLDRKGISYTDMTFLDLGAKRRSVPNPVSFSDRFAQYNYIFGDIRAKLLKDATLADRLLVLINDEADIYYVRLLSELYGIKAYATYGVPFLNFPKIKAKVNSIYKTKSFAFTEDETKDAELEELLYLVRHYALDSLPFEFAYSNLIEITNAMTLKERLSESGVTIENRFTLNPNDIIYVTCFQHDVFYKEFDDKNVLSDSELVEIDANPSYAKTNLDRRKKKNYLLYNENVLLSRVRQHLQDKIYDSQFLSELDIDLKERGEEGYQEKKQWKALSSKANLDHEEAVYTSKAAELFKADQYDKLYFYGTKGEYHSYDHRFKGIVSGNVYNPEHWSVTNLQNYILCPFRYYMERVLPDKDSDKHAMWIGNLGHHLMEKIYAETYDFDVEWDIAAEKYKHDLMKEGLSFDEHEKARLEIAKDWFRMSARYVRRKLNGMSLLKELSETPICFAINDDRGHDYVFNGKIDKILVTGNIFNKWATIIDYKSGSSRYGRNEAMRAFLGADLQIPLYAYALSHQVEDNEHEKGSYKYIAPINEIENCRLGATGIEPILFKASEFFKKTGSLLCEEAISSNVTLCGVSSSDEDYINSIDEIKRNEKGKVIAQTSDLLRAKLTFKEENGPENILTGKEEDMPYNFADLMEDAKNGAILSIESILANRFPIEPTSKDLMGNTKKLHCKGCIYRDICYRHPSDAASYKVQISNRFRSEEPNQNEEEEVEENE